MLRERAFRPAAPELGVVRRLLMRPLLKCIIAGIAEVAVIVTLFWSVDSGSIQRKPTFTEFDAIFWTMISIPALGFVIYLIKRSIK